MIVPIPAFAVSAANQQRDFSSKLWASMSDPNELASVSQDCGDFIGDYRASLGTGMPVTVGGACRIVRIEANL
jgi:hypothetical protein